MRLIIDEQKNAGGELQGEEGEQYGSQGIPDIDVARQQVAGKILRNDGAHAQTAVEPSDQTITDRHPGLLTDPYLIALDGDRQAFKGMRRRSAGNLTIGRKAAAMAGTNKLPFFRLPLHYASQMCADRGKSGKITGRTLQQHGRPAAEIEKMRTADGDLGTGYRHLFRILRPRLRREKAPGGPQREGRQQRTGAAEGTAQNKTPSRWRLRDIFHINLPLQ